MRFPIRARESYCLLVRDSEKSENQYLPLPALLKDRLIRPSIFHWLVNSLACGCLFPLNHSQNRKKSSFALVCGQEEDQVLSLPILDHDTCLTDTEMLNGFQSNVFSHLLPALSGPICNPSYLSSPVSSGETLMWQCHQLTCCTPSKCIMQ